MKKLDEVIKAFEECIVPKNVFCNGCYKDDRCKITEVALYYLKQYQLDKQIFAYDIAKKNLELSERNEPLTWDELNLMEGKPVWIEGPLLKEGPHWIILGAVHLYEGKNVGYGKTWQAYRKERK